MFGIGMSEMLIICAVALLVFGPNELPQVAKKIARGLREVRKVSDDFKRSIDFDDDDEPQKRPQPRRLDTPDPADEPRQRHDLPATIAGSRLSEVGDDAPHRDVVTMDGERGDDDGTHAVGPDSGIPAIVPAGAISVGSTIDDADDDNADKTQDRDATAVAAEVSRG